MAKKTPKLQPAVETLTFATSAISSGVYNGRFFIDLAKAASVVNRRAYRQGRQWMVAGFTLFSAGTGAVTISKLPVNWVTANSWEKSFRAWDKQQKLAIENAGAQSTMSKYRDFKICMNDDHAGKWFNTTFSLLPVDSQATAYTAGEWEPSQITLPGPVPTEKTLHMLGADGASSLGMIEGYAISRARVQSPAPDEGEPENGFLAQMFDDGGNNALTIDNATDKNDSTPYSAADYPGSAANGPNTSVHAYANIITQSTGAGALGVDITKAPGGMFPCGLIAIDWNEASDSNGNANLVIQVHMVPGGYRGYLAPPMTEL